MCVKGYFPLRALAVLVADLRVVLAEVIDLVVTLDFAVLVGDLVMALADFEAFAVFAVFAEERVAVAGVIEASR